MSIIRIKRKEKGLTQKQLAEMLGMPYQSLQRYENGVNSVKNMTLEKAVALAKVLEITPEELLEGDK